MEIATPGRIVYPNHQFTKLDVVQYYARVARFLLPHLKDRPVTLLRYPDTTVGPVFYEKDAPEFTPEWVKTFPVPRRSGESDIRYIVIDDLRTLVWAASVGTIEIHPFLARLPDIQSPVEIVFDLDPGEGVNIIACARVALLLRDLLRQLQLASFAKVSGSAGLQVYVPLNTPATYGVTQVFAKAISELLHQQHPELIVAEMQRSERKGRVLIDWSQNVDYKTTVGVYSLRAKRHRPFVSLPVKWEELSAAIEADDSSLLYWYAWEALERVEEIGDLFAPVLTLRQSVPESFVQRVGAKAHSPLGGTQRRGAVSKAAKRTKRSKTAVRELPLSSAQGGRRRFLLRSANSSGTGFSKMKGVELDLETGNDWRCWLLDRGLPAVRSKTTAQQSDFCIADEQFDLILRAARRGEFPTGVLDVGTYELVEGNLDGDYAHLFFSGHTLNGDLFLVRSAAERWIVSRAPQSAPGVRRDDAA